MRDRKRQASQRTGTRPGETAFPRNGLPELLIAITFVVAMIGAPSVGGTPDPPISFTDVTVASGIDFIETIGDDAMSNIVESAGVGCGFLDYDSDGWLDIFLVNGRWLEGLSDPTLDPEQRRKLASATNRLYRNRGDATFEDVTVRAGLAHPAYGMGVVVADYDGDGDADIYVTNYGPNRLYRNNGDGTFTDVARQAGVDDKGFGVGAIFFDYNRDGWLDLYVGNYLVYDPDYRLYYAPDAFPGPLDYNGQQDELYRNNGDGTFTDVTRSSGINIQPTGRAMGVGGVDYDDDGFPDVFVSNDAMENFLFRNKGDGTFDNRALASGVAFGQHGDATAAMGVEIGDYDNDGRFDVFVPDMAFSCLYRNVGRGLFDDQAAKCGIAQVVGQYTGWGAVFADYNLDGRLDLYVSTGDAHHLEASEDALLLGSESGRFVDVSESAGECMAQKQVGRGAAGGDFDNDGDIDVLVTNLNDRPALLRNDTPRGNRHWLTVSLVGQPPNRDAIGAVARMEVGALRQMRQRMSGGSYLSQHDPRLHFGLGDHAKVDRLEVTWPDGSKSIMQDVRPDQLLTVRQGSDLKSESRR